MSLLFVEPEDDPGLWLRIDGTPGTTRRPALFLDRDGVVVVEVGFLHEPEKVEVRPGVASLITACHDADIAVVIVTNQSGVGRGLYDWRDFASVQERIRIALGPGRQWWQAEFACGYHPRGEGRWQPRDHVWRKPGAGMLEEGARRLNLDLERSWIIGDRATDMGAGAKAGIAGGVLMPGPTTREEPDRVVDEAGPAFPVHVCDDLVAAHRHLSQAGFFGGSPSA